MAMITKINQLKEKTTNVDVRMLCESTINAISSAIYNNVTVDAQLEIERVALTNLFEGLEKFNEKFINEWVDNQKRVYAVKHLGVRKAVNTLIEKEGKFDQTLSGILENFRENLDNIPEVLLYEEFISAMSRFNYLPAVNTELEAVADRVKKYKNDVDISKIIEVMKDTRSSYLIPLIEDVVDNYLSNKTEQSKSSLKETLVKFSYDAFVLDILNIVMLDATQLQLEYANTACDITDKLFSPIMYLGENEALFNVHGTYYIKKSNHINKIKKEDVENLDESFKAICEIINLPNIEVSKKDIKVFIGNDNAVLLEKETYINDSLFNEIQINEAAEVAQWGGNSQFFNIVKILRENFNEIAELDFVKRVHLKENENYAADVFKLRDNIFITTLDPINNKATFYRNINPIQAEKIMMEHMRFDVSKTFREILPNKDKILSEIESTKTEFNDYIRLLEERLTQFLSQPGDVAVAVVEVLKEEVEDVKNDYKNYLNEVEQYIGIHENLNITVQDDATGKSYTVVVPTGAMASKGNDGVGEVGPEGAEGDLYGTEVGMSSMTGAGGAGSGGGMSGGASSAVTFDGDDSELLSDEPSAEEDAVELGADDMEAYADKVDAEAELESPEGEDVEGEVEGLPGEEGADINVGDTGELGADGTGDTAELDLGEPVEPSAEGEEKAEEPVKSKEEGVEPPSTNLERTNFNKDKNPNDLDEPKKIKKVFLKRTKK